MQTENWDRLSPAAQIYNFEIMREGGKKVWRGGRDFWKDSSRRISCPMGVPG